MKLNPSDSNVPNKRPHPVYFFLKKKSKYSPRIFQAPAYCFLHKFPMPLLIRTPPPPAFIRDPRVTYYRYLYFYIFFIILIDELTVFYLYQGGNTFKYCLGNDMALIPRNPD